MKKEKRKECYQFTILYFFGIIMVLTLHCKGGGFSLFYEWFEPSVFVLALFAFSSGYFYTKNINRMPLSILWNKFKKLIIPLYGWNLFYGILVDILKNIGLIKFGGVLNVSNCFLGPIYSGFKFLFNKAAWFVIPIFVVQIFSILILPMLKKKNGPYIIFIIYVIIGMIGIKIAMLSIEERIIIILIRVLYVWPFFAFGILYKEKLEKYDKLPNLGYFAIIFVLQFLLIYINNGMPKYLPVNGIGYKDVLTPILFGFLGIAFWFRISRVLVPILKNSKIVNLISKNSFSIMMHQYLGFFILNLILLFFNISLGIFQGFSFSKFQKNLGYKYIPENLPQFKTVYLVFGIGISLGIAFVENKIKYFLLKFSERYEIANKIKKCKELIITKHLKKDKIYEIKR